MFFSDCGRIAPERKKWRFGCGFRRPGQPDGVWPARSRIGSVASDNVVRDHFHAHIDHAFDFGCAQIRAEFCSLGRKASADDFEAGNASARRTADGSAESSADAEINR
jgi:hypothetical protein